MIIFIGLSPLSLNAVSGLDLVHYYPSNESVTQQSWKLHKVELYNNRWILNSNCDFECVYLMGLYVVYFLSFERSEIFSYCFRLA